MRENVAERLHHDGEEYLDDEYARSLTTVRIAGAVALRGELEPGNNAYDALEKDWDSALAEMIKLSPELSAKLEINRVDTFQTLYGKMVDNNGHPMTWVINNAVKKSKILAAKDPRMATQYRLDLSHLYNMHRVNEMTTGETGHNTRLGLSIDPKEAMKRDGKQFWEDPKKGFYYVEGMAFLQLYHVPGIENQKDKDQELAAQNGELMTGTYSVDMSDQKIWLETLEEFGLLIPKDESTDNYVRYGLELQLTTEQALALPHAIRARYYQKCQSQKQRLSINEFMNANREEINQQFKALYIPMTKAASSGKKNTEIHTFAASILGKSEAFKPEVRKGLLRIINRTDFDDADARLVEDIIRYGVVESLRLDAIAFAGGKPLPKKQPVRQEASKVNLIRNIVDHIRQGVEARRVYIACGALSDFSTTAGGRDGNASSEGGDTARNGNEIFGGSASSSEESTIPDHIRCIKCTKFSKKEDVVSKDKWCCPKCDYAIDICTGEEIHQSRIDAGGGAKIIDLTIFRRKKSEKAIKQQKPTTIFARVT